MTDQLADRSEGLGFTEESLDSTHVCLIYDREEDRWQVMARFLAAGLQRGELVRYFAKNTTPELLRARLLEHGLEIDVAEAEGSFVITSALTAYCPQGSFDPREVIVRIGGGYEEAHLAGYAGTRAAGEMCWALDGLPGSERFLEYEQLLNTVSTPYRHSGMCQYDARLFDGATVFGVLQVHPYVVAQGQIVRNPCYRRPSTTRDSSSSVGIAGSQNQP